ncbi:unnamed protein product [Diamesa serratosioi]
MKLILLVLAISLVLIVEGKPLEDIERKCIVKYLSERELLDSSFEVEAETPENCDELLSAKISEIYAGFTSEMKEQGIVDIVLKSLLYGNSKEAEELTNTISEIKRISEEIDNSWKYRGVEKIKNLNMEYQNATTNLYKTNAIFNISDCTLNTLESFGFSRHVLKLMAAESDFDVLRLSKMKTMLLDMIRKIVWNCSDPLTLESMFPKKKDLVEGSKNLSEDMKCLRNRITEEDVEGVTFYRLNIDNQHDCLKADFAKKHKVNDICLSKKMNEMEIPKKLYQLECLSTFNVSVEQRKEMKLEFNNIMDHLFKLDSE